MMKMLESKVVEVIEDSEPEPEVVAELAPPQEEVSSCSIEVEELSNKTLCRSSSRAYLGASTTFGS